MATLSSIEAALERLVRAGALTATERRILLLVMHAGFEFALRGEMVLVPVPSLKMALWSDEVDVPSVLDVELALSKLARKQVAVELPGGPVTCSPLIQVISGENRDHFFGTWLSEQMRQYLAAS